MTTTVVNVNDIVKNTVDIVKGTAEGVNNIVKSKVDVAKSAMTGDVASSSNQSVNVPNQQTPYILVPIENKDRVS